MADNMFKLKINTNVECWYFLLKKSTIVGRARPTPMMADNMVVDQRWPIKVPPIRTGILSCSEFSDVQLILTSNGLNLILLELYFSLNSYESQFFLKILYISYFQ